MLKTDVRPLAGIADSTMAATRQLPDVFDQLILCNVVPLGRRMKDLRESRHAVLCKFFADVLSVFRDAVLEKRHRSILPYLLNDSSDSLGCDFYRALPDAAWHPPRFFRTDESEAGEVMEIQCPGSGWGELPMLSDVYRRLDVPSPSSAMYIEKLSANLCAAAGSHSPNVLHLLDNSSNPSSMRYLMRVTQPPVNYIGHSRGIHTLDAHLVRSHSVQSLIAENLFKARLKRVSDGTCRFDLPPLMIFDQRTLLTLPFLDATRDLFSDDVRASLVYSYPVHESGFRDVDGTWCTIAEFLARPSPQRRYYLKYAGGDTNLNWGSRAVYSLRSSDAAKHMAEAVSDARANRPWIIQPDVGDKADVDYFNVHSGALGSGSMRSKFSGFYGPLGLIGVTAQYRSATKVHGQPDSVCGLAD